MDDILKQIKAGEVSGMQFKERILDKYDIACELVAFSNSHGGKLVVGIKDKTGETNALSYSEVQETTNLLSDIASENVVPSILIKIDTVEVEDGNLVVATVKEGLNKPYHDNKGIVWVKNGADKRKVFDNGLRNLNGGIHADLNPQLDANGKPVGDYATSLLGNGLNNDWLIKNKKPLGDLKLAASLNQRWMLGGRTLGMLAALNYTNEYRTYENMENNLYGIYDAANDKPNYLRHSVDNQYNNNVRLGVMNGRRKK